MSRLTRTAAALVVALAATTGLAGCSDDRLGSAAVVDGHPITTTELQDATEGYLKLVPGAEPGNVQRRILERMILSHVIDTAAREQGVHVSDGEVAKQRDELLKSVGGRKGLVTTLASQQTPVVLAPSYIDRWFKDRVLYTKMTKKIAGGGDPASTEVLSRTADALTSAGKSLDIEVSPRYGTWSTRRGIAPLVSGGLSKTAAQLNAGG
jgi:hypothetical protein